MLITRPNSQVFIPTFALSMSVGGVVGAVALLVSGWPLGFSGLAMGLGVLYAMLAADGFVKVRRANDRLLIRRAFKSSDVPAAGATLVHALRAHSQSQGGATVALMLNRPGQVALCLGQVQGFSPAGTLRSARAIGERMATCLGIPYPREITRGEK